MKKEKEKEPELIPEGEYDCVIIESKITKSRNSARYGLLFKFIVKGYPDTPLYHSLWLGNYKDFRNDDKRKHQILWRLTSTNIGALDTTFKKLKNNDAFGCVFIGIIKHEEIMDYYGKTIKILPILDFIF